jgi:IclR family pca regulon transcriptional regulator
VRDHASAAGTLERGLHLLSLFNADKPEWTLRELQEQSHLAKATTRRLMLTLERLGWVEHSPEQGVFTLGPQIVRALYAKTSSSILISQARPYLERLAATTTESAHFAQWGHDGAITLDLVSTPRHFKPFTSVGTVMPGLETADAQALVAFAAEQVWEDRLDTFAARGRGIDEAGRERFRELWRKVRAAGIAYDLEGWRPGVCAVAAPVLDAAGQVLASVSVIVPSERGGDKQLELHADAVREAAADISHTYAGASVPPKK